MALYNHHMVTADTNAAMPTPKSAPSRPRKSPAVVMACITGAFFCAYFWLANQMEGISFDTAFIAIFCAFLSSFIVRCFMTAMVNES